DVDGVVELRGQDLRGRLRAEGHGGTVGALRVQYAGHEDEDVADLKDAFPGKHGHYSRRSRGIPCDGDLFGSHSSQTSLSGSNRDSRSTRVWPGRGSLDPQCVNNCLSHKLGSQERVGKSCRVAPIISVNLRTRDRTRTGAELAQEGAGKLKRQGPR